ncbi:hypothetical protein DL93DRAFT_2230517 [Clavulina sp. PMI_390]|nr:hypothetical protein DL93DRAFT_2230517 [Clavulina sp. PMI_390]
MLFIRNKDNSLMNEPNQQDSSQPQQQELTVLGIEPSNGIISSPEAAYFSDAVSTKHPLSRPAQLIPQCPTPRISRVRRLPHPSRWPPPRRILGAHSSRRSNSRVHAGIEFQTDGVPMSSLGNGFLPTHTSPLDTHEGFSASGAQGSRSSDFDDAAKLGNSATVSSSGRQYLG